MKPKKTSQDTKILEDLPLDEFDEFEFNPNYGDFGLLGDDFIQESGKTTTKRKPSADSEDELQFSAEFAKYQRKGKPEAGEASQVVTESVSDEIEEEIPGKRRIKKLKLTPEEIQERKETRKKRRSQNPEILAVTYVFAALFVLVIGYFVYFNAFVSEEVINSAYNVRVNSFEDRMIRGDIVSSDGVTLAETLVDENGNETRYYPMGRIFAHAIGTSDINQSGVELSHNFYLLQSNANPIYNMFLDIRGTKIQSDRVVTTLDAQLQEVAYNALGYNDGVVIAIEPSTGKILAMVSKPDYDPNSLIWDYDYIISDEGNDSLLNKATFGLFVPGSIFKTLTALSYIRSGADTSSYHYLCEGQINFGSNDYITCFNQTVHGEEDFMDSFAYSCNSSFSNIGLSLQKDQLKETCESLFFNNELPTSIPHAKSRFDLSSNDSDWLVGATSIGQGNTQVTPLHMAMLASAIANGGNLMEPYMVDSTETADGERRTNKFLPESYGQIMTTKEADMLGELMEAVVDYGTAYSLAGYGYSVAGKTGTAEVNDKGDNSWFIGYAPVEQPEIAICVLVENDEGYYESALPVANAVLQNYLNR